MHTDPWTTLSEREVYDNPWIKVVERRVLDPSGKPGVYGLVRFKKLATGAFPLDDQGRVHLVGQWRVPFGRYSWEIPEGGAEAGEGAEETARRELREEAGLAAGAMRELLRMDLSNSVTDEHAVVFLATDLTPVPPDPDSTEVLERRIVSFQELLEEVRAGSVTDAITVAATYAVHYMAVRGDLPARQAEAVLGR